MVVHPIPRPRDFVVGVASPRRAELGVGGRGVTRDGDGDWSIFSRARGMLFLLRMGEVYSGRPRLIAEGLGGEALRLASSQIVTRSLTVELRVRFPCIGIGEATEVPMPPLKEPCESRKRL